MQQSNKAGCNIRFELEVWLDIYVRPTKYNIDLGSLSTSFDRRSNQQLVLTSKLKYVCLYD